jgi:DNA polymerase III delta' subunit
MSFSSIIGQPLALELTQRWLGKGSTNPLLFYGPEGVGKKALALEVAKALNCLKQGGKGGCDACTACRKIASGQHPDVRVIDFVFQAALRGEDIEKQQNLRIETVQAERHRLLQSPMEGPWKVSVIDDAHRFTPEAANSLLKLLEEPPERTAIFLVTPFRDRLVATILSRCQPLRFRPLSDDEMQKVLTHQKVVKDQQIRLIELAQGSPGRALHMSREEQIQAVLEAEALWGAIPGQTPGRILSKNDGRGKGSRPTRNDIEERLNCLLLPASRAMRSGDAKATQSIRLIQEALRKIRQNVQPSLVFEHLLLQLAQQRNA